MHRFRSRHWMLFLVMVVTTAQVFGQTSSTKEETPTDLHELVDTLDLSNSPLMTEGQEVADLISRRVSSTEWLGALAPVAISPFFGLTCLSGIAIVGEEHLPEGHYLRRASSPLRHPLVFLTFLILTIVTSVPKFSKVSKPFAQAVDQLEMYSAIIILLVIRIMSSIELDPLGDEQVTVVFQAGIVSFSAETLLMLATVANIIVINTVKFFFEVMIWITPVPFIDAIFEAASKMLCAALVAVYAFSPAVATVINLLILAACSLAFRWVKRREVYYRTVLFDFVRDWWNAGGGLPRNGEVTVFPKEDFLGIRAISKCKLSADGSGWSLRVPRLFRPPLRRRWTDDRPVIKRGLLMNSMQIGDCEFRFGKRYNRQLDGLATLLRADYDARQADAPPVGDLAPELA